MTCKHLRQATTLLGSCEETQDGALVRTSCLYPSFERVGVLVVRIGDGFLVHDGGEARQVAWQHGRESRLADRQIRKQADRFGLLYENGRIEAKVQSEDWLENAILSVANAASIGAYKAVERIVQAAEQGLQRRIYGMLSKYVPMNRLSKDYEIFGASGKPHRFDFAVNSDDDVVTLIDAVTPHHVSISAKYVAFADMKERSNTDRIVVHDSPMKSDDKALLQQVADVLPFVALEPLVTRMVAHH